MRAERLVPSSVSASSSRTHSAERLTLVLTFIPPSYYHGGNLSSPGRVVIAIDYLDGLSPLLPPSFRFAFPPGATHARYVVTPRRRGRTPEPVMRAREQRLPWGARGVCGRRLAPPRQSTQSRFKGISMASKGGMRAAGSSEKTSSTTHLPAARRRTSISRLRVSTSQSQGTATLA